MKDLEQKWLELRLNDKSQHERTYKHAVSCRDFFRELDILVELTWSEEIRSFRRVIENAGLIDPEGNWIKGATSVDDIPPPCDLAAMKRAKAQGLSDREAYATVAVRNRIAAASFAGAMAQVRRKWNSHLRSNL